MRHLSMLLVALCLCACGGGGDDASAVDAGPDAARRVDASTSPAQVNVRPNQVTNVGVACKAANDCEGERPACQTNVSVLVQQIPFPGGYCSATCKKNSECGEGGECPVAESLSALTSAIPMLPPDLIGSIAPSNCYLRCTSDSDCRMAEGYRCTSVLSAISGGLPTGGGLPIPGDGGAGGLLGGGFDITSFISGPIRDGQYCLPPAPALDAGVADGGTSDSGTSDAGATLDAAAPDAQIPDASAPDTSVGEAAVDATPTTNEAVGDP